MARIILVITAAGMLAAASVTGPVWQYQADDMRFSYPTGFILALDTCTGSEHTVALAGSGGERIIITKWPRQHAPSLARYAENRKVWRTERLDLTIADGIPAVRCIHKGSFANAAEGYGRKYPGIHQRYDIVRYRYFTSPHWAQYIAFSTPRHTVYVCIETPVRRADEAWDAFWAIAKSISF